MQVLDYNGQGRKCFQYMIQSFIKEDYTKLQGARDANEMGMTDNSDQTKQIILDRIDMAFERFFGIHQPYLGHYFRQLYNIIKFVDKSKLIEKNERGFYTNLIRAQLSSVELGLIFYNGLSKRGEKFRILIEKYALLKGISPDVLAIEIHKQLYDEKGAYGEFDDDL